MKKLDTIEWAFIGALAIIGIFAIFGIIVFCFDDPTECNSNIYEEFISNDKYALYKENGRIDLVKLSPKVYKQPYSVEKTIIDDIMVYKSNDQYVYLISRDKKHWVFDIKKEIAFEDSFDKFTGEFDKGYEFTDIYYTYSYEDWVKPPKYPTCFFNVDDIHFRVTYNTFVDEYYFEYKTKSYSGPPDIGVRYFKIEPPCVYEILNNGNKYLHNLEDEYIKDFNEMPENYKAKFNDLSGFQDISKLKYETIKVTDNYNY